MDPNRAEERSLAGIFEKVAFLKARTHLLTSQLIAQPGPDRAIDEPVHTVRLKTLDEGRIGKVGQQVLSAA